MPLCDHYDEDKNSLLKIYLTNNNNLFNAPSLHFRNYQKISAKC